MANRPPPTAATCPECGEKKLLYYEPEQLCIECHKHPAEYCGNCYCRAEQHAARDAAAEERWRACDGEGY